MRVVQVSKYFHPYSGGLESNVLGLSRGLREKNVVVVVVTSKERGSPGRDFVDGMGVYRSSILFSFSNAPFNPGVLFNLFRLDYDLIHLHLPDPFNSLFCFVVSVLRGKPLVVTYHCDAIRGGILSFVLFFYDLFLRVLLARSSAVIATSRAYIESSKFLRGLGGKVLVVPNFTDTKKFNLALSGKKIREKHGIVGGRIILFVGRLVPYKGVEYLIRAFAGLKEKMGDVHLVVVGDGPLRGGLEKLAGELNLTDVYFTGRVSDEELPYYYAAADVFVLPSITRQEAFGVSLIEAMASGKPVVSTNVRGSGVSYVVGGAGIVVEPENVVELQSAIAGILSDVGVARDFGLKGRFRVEREFSMEKAVLDTVGIYESVLNSESVLNKKEAGV